MPLIKVSSKDEHQTKLISASDLESLKQKAEEKLAFKIDKFTRREDGVEVQDNDTLKELLSSGKEVWLIASQINNLTQRTLIKEPQIKISTLNQNKPVSITANSLQSLKMQTTSIFNIVAQKIVRKSDGLEIDDEDLFSDLINGKEEVWLIALEADEDYDPNLFKFENYQQGARSVLKSITPKTSTLDGNETDDSHSFLKDFDAMERELETVKKTGLASVMNKGFSTVNNTGPTTINNLGLASVNKAGLVTYDLKTVEVDRKKKELEDKLKSEQMRRDHKQKELDEIRKLDTNLKNEEAERKRLEEEYRRQLFTVETTRIASKTDLKNAESRLLELKTKQAKIASIFAELKKAEKVDICFMCDSTGSMDPYIAEAKNVIHRIIDKLKNRFSDFELRASFVGYRDHSEDVKRVILQDFSENIDSFKAFVSKVEAFGGDDQCEDVFGGLEEVTKLNWSNMTRILFHIGDAPCHGERFHLNALDYYPAGDPRGLNITNLLRDIINKNIFYYFAEINASTAKMIEEFDKELLALGGNRVNCIKLSSVDSLTEMVSKSIVASITESKSMSLHSTRGKTVKDTRLDPRPVDWSQSAMRKYKAKYYSARYVGDINQLKEPQSIVFDEKDVEIWMAPKPFAKGSMRYAYAGYLNDGILKKSVMKESIFKDLEHNTMKSHKEQIENQVIASYLAKSFFSLLKRASQIEKSVKFVDVSLIHLFDEGKYYSIEDFISGGFVKWTNNAGYVDEDIYSCTLDAFAHWTYQASNEYLIVTDLQGMVIDNKEYVLTDPAIASPEDFERFTDSNLGIKGVQKFFQSHQCNHICKHLNLKRHKYQVKPDRDQTPAMTKIA